LQLLTQAASDVMQQARDRRMMPARRGNKQTQIEERMHEEYVIGYYKPEV